MPNARTPHGHHYVALIREEPGRAGFAAIEIDARDASLLPLAIERATAAIAASHGEGPVAGKIQADVIVASR